jgi:hypothetical protein
MNAEVSSRSPDRLPDLLTLIAMSCLAYVLAVGLHEHGGHAVACVLLGSHPLELGAFYVNCDDHLLSSLGARLVAIAGPVASLITGLVSFAILVRLPLRASAAVYFTWLLGTLGLMEAAGYFFFSGVTGLGDLGTTQDGAFVGASPEWLWRLILTVVGVGAYACAIALALRRLGPHLAGDGFARFAVARRAALISYVAGAAVYLLMGAFNPYGWSIVLRSALPSSLGGTSGLFWMFYYAPRARTATGPGLYFGRQWGWVIAGVVAVAAYALIFARTLRPYP